MKAPAPRIVPDVFQPPSAEPGEPGWDRTEGAVAPTPAAPLPISSSIGLSDVGDPLVPPDTMGAAGPNHLASILNHGYAVWAKSGPSIGSLETAEGPDLVCGTGDDNPNLFGVDTICGTADDVIYPISLQAFWQALGTGPGQPAADVFDPKIMFDQHSGRWLTVSVSNRDSIDSHVLFGVSDTGDPTGTWQLFAIQADPPVIPTPSNPNPGTTWADYPGFGVDADHVYITANMFLITGSVRACDPATDFCESRFWVIDKASAIAGGPLIVDPFIDPTGGFTWQPGHSFDPPSLTPVNYVISEGWRTSTACLPPFFFPLPLFRIQEFSFPPAPAPPVLTDLGFIIVSRYGFEIFDFETCAFEINDALQPACQQIETNDFRLLNAVLRNGKLWTTHHVDDTFVDGVAKTEVAWYEIDPALADPSTPGMSVQEGRVSDPVLWYYYPSIAVNFTECVALGFSGSGTADPVGAYYTLREPADPPGTMQSVTTLQSGIDPYFKLDSQLRNRWGDYSATVVDPEDDLTFWTIQEVAFTSPGLECEDGRWATWWGSFQCSTTPMCLTDPECDDGVLCNGAEICLAGFCQPGPPPTCADGDPCTLDVCDTASDSCINPPIPDSEIPAGADGICNTADDNIDLFGADGVCGTGDDLFGDGLCDAIDNCPDRVNPGQADDDGDGVGNVCDASPCVLHSTAYIAHSGGGDLVAVDVASGGLSTVSSSGGTGVDLNAAEDTAYLTDGNSLLAVDLATGTSTTIHPPAGMSSVLNGAFGVAVNAAETVAYVAEPAPGELTAIDLTPGPGLGTATLVATGLGNARGVDLNVTETTAYVTDSNGDNLRSVNLVPGPGFGSVTLIASGLGGGAQPEGIAVDDADTTAYVTVSGAGTLLAVDLTPGPTFGNVQTVTSGLSYPRGIDLNLNETVVYVSENNSNELSKVDVAPGATFGDVSLIASGLAFQPIGLTLARLGGPISMSIPGNASGASGSTIVIPVEITDLTGRGVFSADITVRFNPAVLQIPTTPPPNGGVTLGSVATGCTLTTNLTTPGLAVISVFCGAPMSGAGSLADIDFEVLGLPGEGSPLTIETALLNEGNPAFCADHGAFTVPDAITGQILYYREETTSSEPSAKPIDGATVDLTGFSGATDVTDCLGSFALHPVTLGQDYTVSPGKGNDFDGGIDPFDASLNAQHVVGLITLTANQQLAADVTGNGALTSFDSSNIAQFTVGSITQFPVAIANGSDWTFVPAPLPEPNQSVVNPVPSALVQGSISYTPLVQSATGQDFHGILYGDVSGNWQSSCGAAASLSLSASSADKGERADRGPRGRAGRLTLPMINAAQGGVIRVPIRAVGVQEAVSFYLDLRFDPAVLEVLGIETGAAATGFSLTSNHDDPGRARVALFHAFPLSADGDVAVVTFRVVGRPRDSTTLTLPVFTINEGRIGAVPTNGSVRVLPGHPREKDW